MEKELVSELAAQPKEGKKKKPTIKEKKRHKQQKEKKPNNQKQKKQTNNNNNNNKRSKVWKTTKNNPSFSPQSQARENKQQNLHKILHKTNNFIIM